MPRGTQASGAGCEFVRLSWHASFALCGGAHMKWTTVFCTVLHAGAQDPFRSEVASLMHSYKSAPPVLLRTKDEPTKRRKFGCKSAAKRVVCTEVHQFVFCGIKRDPVRADECRYAALCTVGKRQGKRRQRKLAPVGKRQEEKTTEEMAPVGKRQKKRQQRKLAPVGNRQKK